MHAPEINPRYNSLELALRPFQFSMPPSALAPTPEVEFTPLRYRVHAFRQSVSPDTDRAAHPGRLEQERGRSNDFTQWRPSPSRFQFPSGGCELAVRRELSGFLAGIHVPSLSARHGPWTEAHLRPVAHHLPLPKNDYAAPFQGTGHPASVTVHPRCRRENRSEGIQTIFWQNLFGGKGKSFGN